MSDFNPVTLFFILSESMGGWLWGLVALTFLLLAGIAAGVVKLYRARMPAGRALKAALVAGLVTTIVFAFLVPVWTLASPAALAAPMMNLSHSASFHSWEKIAPSKSGIKHLGYWGENRHHRSPPY